MEAFARQSSDHKKAELKLILVRAAFGDKFAAIIHSAKHLHSLHSSLSMREYLPKHQQKIRRGLALQRRISKASKPAAKP